MDISNVTWRKASYSGGNGGECVEVASNGNAVVAVRDSKDPNGPKLVFTSPVWESFVQRVRNRKLGMG
jgi:hypothetical protein